MMPTETSDLMFDENTALIVVDVQNDFADPGGNLYVDGGERIIALVNDLITSARAADTTVVYTQDWHPPATPHFEKDGGTWPVHCVADTWGAELHPELDVDGPVIRKGTRGEDGYSGFTAKDVVTGEDKPTDLRGALDERGIRRVVVVGLAQDVCVKETALDAVRLGYETIVPRATTRAVNASPGDDQRAVDEMVRAGVDVR